MMKAGETFLRASYGTLHQLEQSKQMLPLEK